MVRRICFILFTRCYCLGISISEEIPTLGNNGTYNSRKKIWLRMLTGGLVEQSTGVRITMSVWIRANLVFVEKTALARGSGIYLIWSLGLLMKTRVLVPKWCRWRFDKGFRDFVSAGGHGGPDDVSYLVTGWHFLRWISCSLLFPRISCCLLCSSWWPCVGWMW